MGIVSWARRSASALVALVLLTAPVRAQEAAQASSPVKGDVIPVLETVALDGRQQKIEFPKGSKTVLLFFLSGCPTCHRMIPEWNQAYDRRPKDLRVVGVIMDQEPPGFWSTLSVRFPVVRSPGREFLRALRITKAPLTVRVAAGGKVEDLGLGLVDPIRLGELFRP